MRWPCAENTIMRMKLTNLQGKSQKSMWKKVGYIWHCEVANLREKKSEICHLTSVSVCLCVVAICVSVRMKVLCMCVHACVSVSVSVCVHLVWESHSWNDLRLSFRCGSICTFTYVHYYVLLLICSSIWPCEITVREENSKFTYPVRCTVSKNVALFTSCYSLLSVLVNLLPINILMRCMELCA